MHPTYLFKQYYTCNVQITNKHYTCFSSTYVNHSMRFHKRLVITIWHFWKLKSIHPHNFIITRTIQESEWMNSYSPIPIASRFPTNQTQTPPTSSLTTQILIPPAPCKNQMHWTNQIQPHETSNILSIQQAISSQNLMTYCSLNTSTITMTKLGSPTSSSIHYQLNSMNTTPKETRIPEVFHLQTILVIPKKLMYKRKLRTKYQKKNIRMCKYKLWS